MKTTVNNTDYLISFPEATGYINQPISTTRSILCNIRKSGEADKVLASGLSHTHRNDRFVRTTGEKKSLARAMNIMKWSKEERTQVWNAYLLSSRKRRNLVKNKLEQMQSTEVQPA